MSDSDDAYMKEQAEQLALHLRLTDGKSGYVEASPDAFHVYVRRKWAGKQITFWDGMPVEWHENVSTYKAAMRAEVPSRPAFPVRPDRTMGDAFLAQRVPMPEPQAATIPSPKGAPNGLERLPLNRLDQAVRDMATKMKELRAALMEQERRADVAERQAAELERQLAIAEAKLAVETMHSAGLAAQASHMMAIAIEADVLALSELPEDGHGGVAPKSRLTQVYDAAFDAKGAELGIEDPAQFREA
jgi:hypothetical protein